MTPHARHIAAAAEEMLLDAGLAQDAELRRALLAVGQLANLPAPVPSGRLAALLGGPAPAAPEDVSVQRPQDARTGPGDELGTRRRLRSHRPTVVGLALVAGMGMGVGTVAASPAGSAHTGSLSIQQMLEDWTPSWTIRTPQAGAPGFLQQGIDDDRNDVPEDRHAGLAGNEASLPGDAPLTPQWRPSGHVRKGGEPSSGNGQGGAKESEKTDGAAGRTGPASGVPGESGQPSAARDGAGPTPIKVVPRAKWLEKSIR